MMVGRVYMFNVHPLTMRGLMVLGVLTLSAVTTFGQSSDVPARIDASAYQRVVEENLELRKEQARQDAEAAELRRKNASLLLDVQDVERKKDQLAVLVSQLKTPAETQAELARLQSEKLVLIREIERLRRAAAAVPPPNNAAPTLVVPEPGSDLFRKLEKENADLRLELAKSRESTLNESVARELLTKSDTAQKALITQLTEKYQKASADLENVRRREASLKKALEIQAKKAFDAEIKSQKSEVRSQAAEAGLAKANDEMDRRQSEISDLKSEVGALKSRVKAQGGDAEGASGVGTPMAGAAMTTVPELLSGAQQMLARRRVEDAEKLYLKALKLDPRNPQVCYNLGVLYGDYLKDYRSASKYYRRYIQLAPQAPDVATVRAWLLDLDARSGW